MKRKLALMFVVSATFAATCAAVDAAQIADYVAPQPDVPVKILSCRSAVQFSSGAYGTNHANLTTIVDFQNVGSKSVVAVLLRFQMSNALGDVLDNILEQATGQFATDAVIRGTHFDETD